MWSIWGTQKLKAPAVPFIVWIVTRRMCRLGQAPHIQEVDQIAAGCLLNVLIVAAIWSSETAEYNQHWLQFWNKRTAYIVHRGAMSPYYRLKVVLNPFISPCWGLLYTKLGGSPSPTRHFHWSSAKNNSWASERQSCCFFSLGWSNARSPPATAESHRQHPVGSQQLTAGNTDTISFYKYTFHDFHGLCQRVYEQVRSIMFRS